MNIKIIEYQKSHYSIFQELVEELQLFESQINEYRTTEISRIPLIATDLIETVSKNNGKLLFAEMDDAVVGFVAFYEDMDLLNKRNHVYVSDLVVTEKYRGKGVAKTLMQEAEKYAKSVGLNIIRVAVLEKSFSKEFYYRLGFTN